jgi:O-antigen ligase
MTIYYVLLAMARFHSDPRLSAVLFDTGIVLVTPVKVVGLLAVLAALLLPPAEDAAPRRGVIGVLFLTFAALPVAATLASGLPAPSLSISSLLSFSMMLIATRSLVTTKERITRTVRVMVLTSGLASLWIYRQHFIQHIDRPPGLEQDPNYEALTLLACLPLAAWLARNELARRWRGIAAVCGVLMGFGVVLTESRAGLVALATLALLVWIYSPRKFVTLLGLAALGLMVFTVAPQDISTRFKSINLTGAPSNGDEDSSRIHFELVKAGLSMMGAHPLFGVGLEQFKLVEMDYNPAIGQFSGKPYIAHNTYIQIGAEAGLPVLLLFLVLMIVALINCRDVQHNSDAALRGLAQAFKFALIVYAIAAASVTAQYVVTYWMIVFLSQNLREIARASTAGQCQAPARLAPAIQPQVFSAWPVEYA